MTSYLNHDYLILIFIHLPYYFMKIHRLLSSLQTEYFFDKILVSEYKLFKEGQTVHARSVATVVGVKRQYHILLNADWLINGLLFIVAWSHGTWNRIDRVDIILTFNGPITRTANLLQAVFSVNV
jgi:hypothetical protein